MLQTNSYESTQAEPASRTFNFLDLFWNENKPFGDIRGVTVEWNECCAAITESHNSVKSEKA